MTALKLPKPDGYGNYWLSPPESMGPVIFRRRANRERGENNRWFLSLGDGGVVFDGGAIKEYKTPMLALEELETMKGGAQWR